MARLLIVEDQPELAALIGSAARTRGHDSVERHTGEEAFAELAAGARFDAAIVDLMLPDMRGQDVLARLKKAEVPAFAVSGVYKGEKFAKEAMETHGARGYFEKPFDLDALLDAVEGVTGGGAREHLGIDDLEELEVAVQAPADASTPMPFADRERVWGSGLAERPADRPAPQPWATTGKLGPGSISRLLNAYYQARHTGELKLRHQQVLKVVFFEAGQPVYAASNLANERFARFCARRGLIGESDMAAVASLAKDANIRTGEAMIQLELITQERRRELLQEQVKEIIWSTFAWTEGEYGFTPKRPARTDMIKLTVFPGDLIMEGARREPLVTLRKKIPAETKLFPSADPPYHLHEIQLGGPEAHLLVWADGSKSVEDLVALSDLSERDVVGTLYGFLLLGLLEERKQEAPSRRITFGL